MPGLHADLYVLVTSSRTWDDERAVFRALDELLAGHAAAHEHTGQFWRVTVFNGMCGRGGDLYATRWVESRRRMWGGHVTERGFPAEWRVGGHWDRAAGFKRNTLMVARLLAVTGWKVCLAFADQCRKPRCAGKPAHITHGTAHCAGEAEKAGIEIRYYGFAPEAEQLLLTGTGEG